MTRYLLQRDARRVGNGPAAVARLHEVELLTPRDHARLYNAAVSGRPFPVFVVGYTKLDLLTWTGVGVTTGPDDVVVGGALVVLSGGGSVADGRGSVRVVGVPGTATQYQYSGCGLLVSMFVFLTQTSRIEYYPGRRGGWGKGERLREEKRREEREKEKQTWMFSQEGPNRGFHLMKSESEKRPNM